MALGRRKSEQRPLWIANDHLPRSPGHPFYQALNRLLAEADFDRFVEDLCVPYYAKTQGRPGIPPGVYFRMLLVGYFEGIGSQRGIAWRCSDSLSLREFLGLAEAQTSPDHSSLTVIRKRLPLEVHEQVFVKVLAIARQRRLLKGRSVAVDSTTLEANAAMKTIVHRHSGEDWKQFLTRLAEAEGLQNPTEADLRRFDRGRRKRVSNAEWVSPVDPDSRITKMKDGRTHLAYKAEHTVDLETELVLAATVHGGDAGDTDTLLTSVVTAQMAMVMSGSEEAIKAVVADKGYHKAELLAACAEMSLRTYIPSTPQRFGRRWQDKPREWERAYRGNERRVAGQQGKKLSRLRSEYVERSFAHTCETGGGRRTWIRGLEEVTKRYLITVAAHNLGLIMRKAFGVGTARYLQGKVGVLVAFHWLLTWLAGVIMPSRCAVLRYGTSRVETRHEQLPLAPAA